MYLAYLLQHKYNITILEARDRIGGRIYSIDGHDMGPSWVWEHHKNIQEVLDLFGLELFLQYEDGYALYDTVSSVEKFIPQQIMPSKRVDGTLSKLIDKIYENLVDVDMVFNSEVISIEESLNNTIVKTNDKQYISANTIITIPPRVALTLEYNPPLDEQLKNKMNSTQTWMANSAKCIIEFKNDFWRKKGLSGFVFSNIGPLAQIHDACTKDKFALFGFVRLKVDTDNFKEDLKEQLIRVFGIDEDEILNIHIVDWKKEKYTSTKDDSNNMIAHPNYGIDTSSYSNKILFSSTEFSFSEGGYLEGAIINAKKIATKLL